MGEDEAEVDAKIRDTDRAIADLQKVRQDLLRTKAALVKARDPQAAQTLEVDEKALEKALRMLEWNNFKKKDGEWAFMRNRDGSLVEDLKPVADFIDQLRKGKEIVVGKYSYVASEDKFLNRYAAGT